jgi:hypothetical protein
MAFMAAFAVSGIDVRLVEAFKLRKDSIDITGV